ncbi:hypothetical protein AB1M95_09325 [Sulfitobacter sp. LCG007]
MHILPALCRAAGLAALLAGCEAPLTDATISPAAEASDYPALVPLDPLVARMDAVQIDAPATQTALQSRVGALRSRADALRQEGLSAADRDRLEIDPG